MADTAVVESDSESTAGSAGSSAGAGEVTPSLGNAFDEMMGYAPPTPSRASAASAETPDDENGTPPASSSVPATDSQSTPAADSQSEPTGTPPAEADRRPTETAPAPSSTGDDPLASAAPLSYTVDGQARTSEFIKVHPELGGFIEPKDLVEVANRLGERDHYYARNQEQFRTLQAYEQATAWKQGDKTLTGLAALEAREVNAARLAQTASELASQFTPENFTKLVNLCLVQQPDGSVAIDVTPARALLTERLTFLTDRAAFNAQRSFSQRVPTGVPSSPASVASMTREQAAASAEPTITAIVQGQQLGTLSQETKDFLTTQFPRYVIEEQGQWKVDPAFVTLVQHMQHMQYMQRMASPTPTASTTGSPTGSTPAAGTLGAIPKADKSNAAKLAAAMQGQPRSARPALKAPTPPHSEEDDLSPEERAYLHFEKTGAAALRARSA